LEIHLPVQTIMVELILPEMRRLKGRLKILIIEQITSPINTPSHIQYFGVWTRQCQIGFINPRVKWLRN
jgi:hypothetical protein